jgi:hypothetical protein
MADEENLVDTVKVVEFDKAKDMTMDKCIRLIIENMFDYDNDEGTLVATINEGQDNEAVVELYLRIASINGVALENKDTEGSED